MLARGVATALVALSGSACSPRAHDPVERALTRIVPARIQEAGAYLAAEALAGRHLASPEADSVVTYLLQSLEALGIRPSPESDALFGARACSFVHHFSVPLQQLGGETSFAVTDGVSSQEAWVGADFRPLLFSQAAEVLAPVVRIEGRAEELSLRAGVANRVVFVAPAQLVPRPGEPNDAAYYRAAVRLGRLGAAAVVFTEAEDWERLAVASYPSELPPEVAAGARSPRAVLLNLNPPRIGSSLQAAAWRLAPERTLPAIVVRPGFRGVAMPCREARLRIQFRQETALGQNVLVGFGGAAGRGDCILLVAHYDHSGVNGAGEVLNGADDNASGVAALLEITRALAAVHERLHSPVLVAFVSAELQGGLGLESLLQDLELLVGPVHVRAAIVLDAVGRVARDVLVVQGADEHPELLRALERRNRREFLQAPALLLQPRGHAQAAARAGAASWPHAATTDLLQRTRIPAVVLNDGLDPLLYGQPEDDWENVDAHEVARVARLVFATLFDLASVRGGAEALPANAAR